MLTDRHDPAWIAIAREIPRLTIDSVRLAGEGWNSVAFVVNGELVFRFPKRASVWDELQREIAFLEYAAPLLPLPVPRYVHAAPGSSAAPHGFAAYRYLPGAALDVTGMPARARDAAADAIAGFLATLHRLEPPAAIDAMLPRDDARSIAEEYLTGAARHVAPRLEPAVAKRMLNILESFLETPANVAPAAAVLHADLSVHHVLESEGSIAGVLDFGDINRGDPDYDFMYLFLECGRPFVESIARRYGHPDVERLAAKLEYFAVADQIDTILNGPGQALEGQIEAAWARLSQLSVSSASRSTTP